MKIILHHKFEDIVNIENLLLAWQEFVKGKRSKIDVQEFQFCLMDNILSLHRDLINLTYKHGNYKMFKISDPKPRIIHKATVRDRLLHHAVYRILYPFFNKTFISDSYSCRNDKGTHRALNKFRQYSYIVFKNNTKPCWVLKCDIKKFFASVDQETLIKIIGKHICHPEFRLSRDNQCDENNNNKTINLLKKIIFGFKPDGLPLGNLTSQLFANVYLNELDQFVKHKLKAKYYIRYADDFMILSEDKNQLNNLTSQIQKFLSSKLKLTLHPDKIYIKTIYSGLDFLGWVNFSDHRILRAKTKKRILKRLEKNLQTNVVNSYLELLKHGNSWKLKSNLLSLNKNWDLIY